MKKKVNTLDFPVAIKWDFVLAIYAKWNFMQTMKWWDEKV